MSIEFKRATRSQVPLKLGITGPSGSGKTTAGLKLARGLVGPDAPIALLDTENGSASLYSDMTAFDVLDMTPPYQVGKFTQAIDIAVQAGYKALVIDSASAEWSELLIEKEALDARGGNSFANWGSITKKHEDFLKAVRNAPIHLILCLRAKQEHVQDKDANGRTTVRKVGMAAIQREGMEYELTTVFDLAMDHNAKVSKDRTRIFDGRLEMITEATGREFAAWLSSGKPLAENVGEAFIPAVTPPTAPETPQEALQAVVDEAKTRNQAKPVSDLATSFVDEVSSGPVISDTEWMQLQNLCADVNLDLDRLEGYSLNKKYLAPQLPNQRPLRSLLREKFTALSGALGDKRRQGSIIATINSGHAA